MRQRDADSNGYEYTCDTKGCEGYAYHVARYGDSEGMGPIGWRYDRKQHMDLCPECVAKQAAEAAEGKLL